MPLIQILATQIPITLVDRNSSHEVWFDLDRLKPCVDWECYIEEGGLPGPQKMAMAVLF
jgi:hypothetical protein